MNQDGDIEMFS